MPGAGSSFQKPASGSSPADEYRADASDQLLKAHRRCERPRRPAWSWPPARTISKLYRLAGLTPGAHGVPMSEPSSAQLSPKLGAVALSPKPQKIPADVTPSPMGLAPSVKAAPPGSTAPHMEVGGGGDAAAADQT